MAKITLNAIEECDLPLLKQWRNSSNVMPNCRQYRPLSDLDMHSWFKGLNKESDYNLTNDLFMIKSYSKCIGVGGFVRIDWRNRKAEVSFYVGEQVDNSIVRKALTTVIQYGFSTLNLWKASFPCYSYNSNLPVYEEVMKREYIAKKEYFWNGKYHDRIVLVAYGKA